MSMLKKLPKHMPALPDLLCDIFRPSAAELAQAMGVTERTAKRWIAKGEAPKSVMLALFWLTRWGMQWTDADLYNEAQLHFAMNSCQARQIRELKAKLRRMSKIGNFGAANDPNEDAALPLPSDVKPVQVHAPKKTAKQKAHGVRLGGDGVQTERVVRKRVCKAPNSYQHHSAQKRGAA